MIEINKLELRDFTKVYDSGDFNYSGVNGHADYLGWYIIFFKESGCDQVSTIGFDDILMEESIKNIANKILQRIAFFGLNIEKEFNHPQDIEFAIKNKNIYVLQSRPINIITK
jgi:hypothetical protein